mmetsp:Transcript_10085/g.24068  ORF Transcript_10085/g.24068 Transcript_10085/m.24068 type:complete len:98 (-) Transcript_10085:173-466(-)
MTNVMSATNPFDDNFDSGPVDSTLRVNNNNPFDDDPSPGVGGGVGGGAINPFASTDSAGKLTTQQTNLFCIFYYSTTCKTSTPLLNNRITIFNIPSQ